MIKAFKYFTQCKGSSETRQPCHWQTQRSCIAMASLQHDVCLKVQHLPYDLHVEVQQYLVMFCFHIVNLLFFFCYFKLETLLQNANGVLVTIVETDTFQIVGF